MLELQGVDGEEPILLNLKQQVLLFDRFLVDDFWEQPWWEYRVLYGGDMDAMEADLDYLQSQQIIEHVSDRDSSFAINRAGIGFHTLGDRAKEIGNDQAIHDLQVREVAAYLAEKNPNADIVPICAWAGPEFRWTVDWEKLMKEILHVHDEET